MTKKLNELRDEKVKEIDSKVLKVIDDLDKISNEYASWDEWNKINIITKAIVPLKNRI